MNAGIQKEPRLHLGVIGARGIGDFQGGIERYCSEFYPQLPEDRFQVTIFVRQLTKSTKSSDHIKTVRIPTPKLRSLETPFYSFAAILVAYSMRIRVIHVHGISSCLPLPLARLFGMRVVVRHMGAEYDRAKWGFIARRMLRLAEIFCARYAESVVCLNSHIADEFFAATGRRDSIVIPNGVRVLAQETAVALPTSWGITPGSYVLAVGRFVPEKNFDQLISAFLDSDLSPSAKLVLVGEHDYPGPYSRRIDSLCAGNEDRIVRLGVVFGGHLTALYRNSRLFVLPSSHEGMSFSLLEAGVLGAQLVASDIAANREVCRTFGRLYPTGSDVGLRDAMQSEWRRTRPEIEKSRQIAEFQNRFDWSQVVGATATLFTNPCHARDHVTGNSRATSSPQPDDAPTPSS